MSDFPAWEVVPTTMIAFITPPGAGSTVWKSFEHCSEIPRSIDRSQRSKDHKDQTSDIEQTSNMARLGLSQSHP
jgi:hypothetical protein